jgi:hypothetical protein
MARETEQLLREWKKLAESKGWTVVETANNHLLWKAPDGETQITTGGFQSTFAKHGLRNAKSALRKAGLFDGTALESYNKQFSLAEDRALEPLLREAAHHRMIRRRMKLEAYREIAEELGRTPGAVQSRVSHLLTLEPKYMEEAAMVKFTVVDTVPKQPEVSPDRDVAAAITALEDMLYEAANGIKETRAVVTGDHSRIDGLERQIDGLIAANEQLWKRLGEVTEMLSKADPLAKFRAAMQ